MHYTFEQISSLEYRLKAAHDIIRAFESGERYIKLKQKHQEVYHSQERQNKGLKKDLSQAERTIVAIRKQWFEVFEDSEAEHANQIAALERELRLEKELRLKAEKERDDEKDKTTQLRRELYEALTELENEKGKVLKLTAQINRDYENSSIPSSKSIKNKKISNSREKTGKKPGGQPGHKGHCRKKQTPTKGPVLLLPPQEILNDPDFKKTSKTIVKQHVGIRVILDVTEYHADVYYNSKTGERVHAQFPPGIVNEVNYDGSIKAFLFLLNNECCTSIDKCRNFLSELTDGNLNISKGTINNLSKEFALKSEQERKALFADLLLSPVMHTDCTNAKVNGESAYVYVCATPDGKALYSASENKGHKGVKDTPVEDYQGILVHDHDRTFYNYGSNHQECLAHILRYLKDSMSNEPDRTWNKEMYSLLREMIHYRNGVPSDEKPDTMVVAKLEERYRKILQKAKEEYDYIPASKYYKDGYNLYIRLDKYMSNHLLFLNDLRVPTTNNIAERLLRNFKRKQQQAVTFRSKDSIDYLCQCMSMLIEMRQKKESIPFVWMVLTKTKHSLHLD